MKSLIANICVSILRKLNVSTLIGYKVEGKLTQLNDYGRIYDNELNCNYYLPNRQAWNVPQGKFSMTQKCRKEAE
ncbi:hypothetical protein AN957_09805 [Cytobacillus solani]|uniref:Uncharacterized protein n=1 Tax=Cytobacillus solani TaxID=1637975 RepID=A0A0Q3VH34_9BACI|nr:hypothetical protein AN957_09805 [Cytobacillus solani]